MAFDVASRIEAAQRWLLESGIQELGTADAGGVHAWYDRRAQAFAFFYPEITGYAITMLLYLHARSGDPRFLELAMLAADWLLRVAWDEPAGLLRSRPRGEGWDDITYAFDNAICLNGLVNLCRAGGDERHLDAARRIAHWLRTVMQDEAGGFAPQFDMASGTVLRPNTKWSSASGAFLAKAAMGILNLADLDGDPSLAESARRLCERAAGEQAADGRFPTDPRTGGTFVHPHCYAAEGLYLAGRALGRGDWLAAASRATQWIVSAQAPDGGFPGHYKDGAFLPLQSPDISAQVLRLSRLLRREEAMIGDTDEAAALASIFQPQAAGADVRVAGGIPSGPAWFLGEPADRAGEHVNAWVTMFALQAALLAESSAVPFQPFLLV